MEKEKEKQKEWILSNSKVCKRCKQSYDPNSNTSTSCRFHPSFFVCRRHDDQKRGNINEELWILLMLFFSSKAMG
uniref:Uncharacterized protein n=1 Tax=Phaseolus vulgaris TaxID=3885 RepID=V7AE31_PHAVU|nr:hypothetical protein PHAVU_011G019000g [Phaseolus vulgaris]ESW03505.1 hypothetical protein PHAVU_011G019000g [Phaseolus vulgaris]